jgi:hypothetical protein
MNAPEPENFLYRWLAAYADDELPPNERARVERWLAENQEARDTLDAQESLARGNAEFWNTVRAPEPSSAQWNDALNRIAIPVAVPSRRWVGWLSTAGLMATAATLFIALPGPQHPCLNPPDIVPGGVNPSEVEPYPMASAADVRIISMPQSAAGLLLVGDHPIGDSLLILAKADEVEFLGVGNDPDGRFPAVPFDPQAADAPMIWAPTPKDPRDP